MIDEPTFFWSLANLDYNYKIITDDTTSNKIVVTKYCKYSVQAGNFTKERMIDCLVHIKAHQLIEWKKKQENE